MVLALTVSANPLQLVELILDRVLVVLLIRGIVGVDRDPLISGIDGVDRDRHIDRSLDRLVPKFIDCFQTGRRQSRRIQRIEGFHDIVDDVLDVLFDLAGLRHVRDHVDRVNRATIALRVQRREWGRLFIRIEVLDQKSNFPGSRAELRAL